MELGWDSHDDYFDWCVDAKGPHHMTWDEWAKITDLAAEIDFGCDFDCNGLCVAARRTDWQVGSDGSANNCCHNCAAQEGYIRRLPIEAVETVKALFDEKTGFWSPDGCRLPGKWRSTACIIHQCSYGGSDSDSGRADWRDWGQLSCYGIDREKNLTVETVREGLRKVGLLKTEWLVQLEAPA